VACKQLTLVKLAQQPTLLALLALLALPAE
jgi:hypothetical protein